MERREESAANESICVGSVREAIDMDKGKNNDPPTVFTMSVQMSPKCIDLLRVIALSLSSGRISQRVKTTILPSALTGAAKQRFEV